MSADTIVPRYTNPESFNRYGYVLNNPLRYTDPTGHRCVGEPEECQDDDGNPINGVGGLGGSGSDQDEESDGDSPASFPPVTSSPEPTATTTSMPGGVNYYDCFTYPYFCGTGTPTQSYPAPNSSTPTTTPGDSLNCNPAELTAGVGLIVIVDVTVVAVPVAILIFVAPEAIAPYVEATEWIYVPANATGVTLVIHSGCLGD